MRWLLILVPLLPAVIAADAQTPTEPQKSPKEVVEQFYKMETGGRWLGPEHWDELQDFIIRVKPWSPPKSVSVLKSYRVGNARKDIGAVGVSYQVEVDSYDWGTINSFLSFTIARSPEGESPAARGPVEQRGYQILYLRDTYLTSGPSGEQEKTGALRWRMLRFGSPFVDVDTALRWVRAMRDESSNPAIKYNAVKTIAILEALSAGGPLPTPPAGIAKESPSETAHRFVDLESGSLPDQWTKLAEFFVETPKPKWDKAHIVDIVNTSVENNADFNRVTISTNSLGVLDSSLRLWNYPPGRTTLDSACYGDDRFDFNLLLSDKHWQIETDGTVKELDGPLKWRILDTSFEPLLTLDTAILYVMQLSGKTADPVVKSNAAKTLRILRFYKQGKPLPDELYSDFSGSCGG